MNIDRAAFDMRNSLSEPLVEDLWELYANEWWTKERKRSDVEKMLAATDLIFAAVDTRTQRLVAFARVLTDRVYLALILDVIVSPAYRGSGLGRLLMDTICSAPQLEKVTSIELVCQPELMPFYQKWGFSDKVGRSRLMRRTSSRVLTETSAQLSAGVGS